MKNNIILIGPIRVGKSTQADLLSEKLSMPRCDVDDIRLKYYKEIGYDEKKADELRQQSFEKLYKYWKQFEIHTIERIVQEYQGYVIDFGAGHSVYEDNEYFDRAKQALKNEPFIVLLLPSSDKQESIEILNARDNIRINEHFVKHESNYKLAKYTVYSKGKQPEETCEDIINQLKIYQVKKLNG
jgi:shikimate kinase